MDKLSLERFNFILQKPVNLLTQDEISFLRARSGALNPMQTEFYAEILGLKQSEEPEEAPKKKRTVKKTN